MQIAAAYIIYGFGLILYLCLVNGGHFKVCRSNVAVFPTSDDIFQATQIELEVIIGAVGIRRRGLTDVGSSSRKQSLLAQLRWSVEGISPIQVDM